MFSPLTKRVFGLFFCLVVGGNVAPAQEKPTEAQLLAAFEKADAARVATKEGTKERAEAAQKMMQLAGDLAWQAFDARKYDLAATHFERSAALKKEASLSQIAHWKNVLDTEVPTSEKGLNERIAQWRKELEGTTDEAKRKNLQLSIKVLTTNRLTVRYGAVSMLQTASREANDNAAWLRYQEAELQIRREELADLQKIESTPLEIQQKKAQIAKALERIASAQQEVGMLAEAEKSALEALEMRRALPEALPERDLGEAFDALGSMAFNALGDLKKAREWSEAALRELDSSLALQLKQLEADPYYTPELKAQMKPEELKAHEERRADLKRMQLVTAALSKAKLFNRLSYIAHETGDLRGATDLAKRALEVGAALPNEKSMWFDLARAVVRSSAQMRLSSIHADSGEMTLALQNLDAAIAIRRELGNANSSADALLQAGRLLYDQEKYAQAKSYVEQARRLLASEQNLDGVLSATGTLALLARGLGDLTEAQNRAEEALILARKLKLAGNVAWAARVLSSINLRQNRLDDAEKLLLEAAPIAERGISVGDKIATLSLQGQLLERQGKNEQAIQKYQAAIALVEGVRATAASETAFADVKTNYEIYERLVKLLIKTGQSEAAFSYLSRAKSKQLQDSLALSGVKTADPVLRAKLDNAGSLDAKLHAIIAQLSAEMAKPADQQNAARIQKLQKVKAETQSQFFQVIDELKKTKPNFDVRVEPADIKSVQRRIPADTLLIQYAPLGDEFYIFLFSRTTLKIVVAPAKPDELWKLIQAVRPQLARGNTSVRGAQLAIAPKVGAASIEANLSALYDLLIAPIEPDIADKKTLAFIPTQWLYYLPMQALATRRDGKLRYLIEDKNVVYLATTGQVNNSMSPVPADELGSGLFAFGDPTGANLPAAREEVATIGQIYPDSQVFSGAAAIKSTILDKRNGERRILHFATHGVLDSNAPEKSYIQLAPGASPEDARLTVSEIQGLELSKVDVVTLSACQTALGEGEPGREVMTLAGAFDRAGAFSVVASLWSVADDSTKELMVEFYQQLGAGKNKAEAMRAAQLKVMSNAEFAHPYHWAPFILMGNWR